jgi:signal peptidase I
VVLTGGRRAVAAAPRHVSARARRTARARVVHGAARVVLDTAAAVGVVCALAAVALLLAGWRPVVLVSGSMSPTMPTGTLVLTRPVPASEVEVGDVVTLPVPGSATRVTHRVTGLRTEDGTIWATLRGDANQADDAAPYRLGGTVLRAAASVPGLGRAVTGTPATVLVIGAAALVVVALLPGRGADRPAPGHAPATARTAAPPRAAAPPTAGAPPARPSTSAPAAARPHRSARRSTAPRGTRR